MTSSPAYSTAYPLDVYAQRRAQLAAQLGAGGIAIIPTAPERQRNRDNSYLYRHDSYFFYLTGFTEPGATLVLTAEGRATLFCQPKDIEREIWDGYRLGPRAAPAALGLDAAYANTEIDAHLPTLLDNQQCIWWPFATHDGLAAQIERWLTPVRQRARAGVLCPAQQGDLCQLLDEMRLIKDPHELATLRRAATISASAHMRAMQTSARMLRAGEDVREYHLDAELLHAFRHHGAQGVAYDSIVAAGANACVLHYRAGNTPVRDGDLVLIDAGCELDGYAADITRTFPANGRFTGPQRDVYQLVLASQQAAIAATRAGNRFTDPHEATVAVLAQGLLDLGLLNAHQHGSAQDIIANKPTPRFTCTAPATGWAWTSTTAAATPNPAQRPPRRQPPQPHPAPRHVPDHRAGPVHPPGRGRARALSPHWHPHRRRCRGHRHRLRAAHARCARGSRCH